MDYYRSNALYDYLKERNIPRYSFVAGNAWQLIYGDNNCNPLLLVFAVGVPAAVIDAPPSAGEISAFNLLSIAASKAKLPVRYVRFASDVESVESVKVADSSFAYDTLTMKELSEMYGSFGLPVSNTQTGKYLNDRTSSAYHNWQRNSLGAALTVSDIDLWRVSDDGHPEIVFELKRSYYDLSRWQPFTDDYRNFRLISNLCNLSGMGFKILYNQRIKSPFQDKIDQLKIFSVDFSKNPAITVDGIITLEEFENL